MKFCLELFITMFVMLSVTAEEWSYRNDSSGPSGWFRIPNTTCAGFDQSPINLQIDSAKFIGNLDEVVTIRKTEEFGATEKFTAVNNGHSVQIDLPSLKWSVTLNQNDPDRYKVQQIHFHWGSKNIGSEHSIDGVFYPLEMHIVMFDSKAYTTPDEAKRSPHGLAVISVLFRIDENSNGLKSLADFMPNISTITNLEERISFQPFSPEKLLPNNLVRFFRYSGSLTTPPCTENVLWTVMFESLTVSTKQLEAFRKLHSTETDIIVNNFRPIQNLNPKEITLPRVVYKSWNDSSFVTFSWIAVMISVLNSIGSGP